MSAPARFPDPRPFSLLSWELEPPSLPRPLSLGLCPSASVPCSLHSRRLCLQACNLSEQVHLPNSSLLLSWVLKHVNFFRVPFWCVVNISFLSARKLLLCRNLKFHWKKKGGGMDCNRAMDSALLKKVILKFENRADILCLEYTRPHSILLPGRAGVAPSPSRCPQGLVAPRHGGTKADPRRFSDPAAWPGSKYACFQRKVSQWLSKAESFFIHFGESTGGSERNAMGQIRQKIRDLGHRPMPAFTAGLCLWLHPHGEDFGEEAASP